MNNLLDFQRLNKRFELARKGTFQELHCGYHTQLQASTMQTGVWWFCIIRQTETILVESELQFGLGFVAMDQIFVSSESGFRAVAPLASFGRPTSLMQRRADRSSNGCEASSAVKLPRSPMRTKHINNKI